jgi:hypothetical protein
MISNLCGPAQQPGQPDPTATNVFIFSEKIAGAIREVLTAHALHPDTVIGVLTYHSLALASLSQHDMVPAPAASPSSNIIVPPHGFKLPPSSL